MTCMVALLRAHTTFQVRASSSRFVLYTELCITAIYASGMFVSARVNCFICDAARDFATNTSVCYCYILGSFVKVLITVNICIIFALHMCSYNV
jgi:hypothetical protein